MNLVGRPAKGVEPPNSPLSDQTPPPPLPPPLSTWAPRHIVGSNSPSFSYYIGTKKYCQIKLSVHRQGYTKACFQINPPPPLLLQWTYTSHVLCTNAHVYLYVCAHKRTCVPLCTCAHGSCSIKPAFLAMAAKRGRRKSEGGRSLQLQDLINFKFILSSTWSCFRWSDMNWQKSWFLTTFFLLPPIYHHSWLYIILVGLIITHMFLVPGSENMYSLLINIYLSLLWSHMFLVGSRWRSKVTERAGSHRADGTVTLSPPFTFKSPSWWWWWWWWWWWLWWWWSWMQGRSSSQVCPQIWEWY